MSEPVWRRTIARKNTVLAAAVALLWWIPAGAYLFADDTWIGADPTSNLWTHPGNWSNNAPPASAPTVENSLFFLGPGQTTNIQDNAASGSLVNNLVFPGPAPAFTIEIKDMSLLGLGIVNQSSFVQTLEMIPSALGPFEGGQLSFHNSATAGNAQLINDSAINSTTGPDGGGATTFFNSSSAGTATINNNAAQASLTGVGRTFFMQNSTAGGATINNFGGAGSGFNGGTTRFSDSSSAGTAMIDNGGAAALGDIAGGSGGSTRFDGSSHAGSATIINEGSAAIMSFSAAGFTNFTESSSAENATIINNPGQTQPGHTQFDSSATAGNATITNNGGDSVSVKGGETSFLTTAGNATINNNGAAATSSASGGMTIFFGGTAANATINNNGGLFSSAGGQTQFMTGATAGNATIMNNGGGLGFGGGGQTTFSGSSDAGSATLIANAGVPPIVSPPIIIFGGLGGAILFKDTSTGGTSRVEVFGNGSIDISGHSSPGVTIGSLEGDGNAFLGANNLTIGSNNMSTNFSGVAQDGGASGGTGGSLTKVGTGALTLSGSNTYTGATAVNAGKLVVDGSIASSSGVTVAAGATLGGHGSVSSIAGAGTVSPGNSPGILTATQVNPSAGMSFLFDFTQPGSPTYSNAAASSNDVLHLISTMPFTTALSSANQITVDFAGASLAAGEVFLGGFFTNTPTATSEVSNATFMYADTGGFTVHFDGFVTEPMAAFAGGTVTNGTVLEFDISGTGTSVPDDSSTFTLLLSSLGVIFGVSFCLKRNRFQRV